MKRFLLVSLTAAIFSTTILTAADADAYRKSGRWFRPKVGVSLSGGLTMLGTHDAGFAQYAIVQVGAHLWIAPRIAIDVVGAFNRSTSDMVESWWSVMPGVRIVLGPTPFYLRGALDIGYMPGGRRTFVIFGGLVGVGARWRVSRHMRLFGEVDVPILYQPDEFVVPVYVQGGVEFVF